MLLLYGSWLATASSKFRKMVNDPIRFEGFHSWCDLEPA